MSEGKNVRKKNFTKNKDTANQEAMPIAMKSTDALTSYFFRLFVSYSRNTV